MTMTKTDPREITLDILLEVLEEGRLGHLVLNQALLKYQYLGKAGPLLYHKADGGDAGASDPPGRGPGPLF